MFRVLLFLALVLPWGVAFAEPPWQTLPPTPPPVPGEHTGHAKVNGISLYYATVGQGSPVVLLHGGLANSDYWGNQEGAGAASSGDCGGQSRSRSEHARCASLRLRPDGG
jgi:hypothetical protein